MSCLMLVPPGGFGSPNSGQVPCSSLREGIVQMKQPVVLIPGAISNPVSESNEF